MIKSLEIGSWRQYKNVKLQFHKNLTIITGANGAGKTTILNIINQHFGWHSNLIATAEQDEKTGVLKYLSGFWKSVTDSKAKVASVFNQEAMERLGEIIYSNDQICNIFIPEKTGTQYSVNLSGQQPLHGFNIPSHRPIYKYQNIATVSLYPITKRAAFDSYRNSQVQRYQGYNNGDRSETYFIKETLISLATLGYGNQILKANQESIKIYEGFDKILKLVLPPKLGFKRISIRVPEVILETESGDFSIDAVSGGIASVIDLAWQIYMYDDENKPFIVVFDEPENHLHPEMQKTLLPNFIKAFPYVQFIVATHNPFIISSVKDSNVYALIYNEEHKVTSSLLNQIDKSGTANEILRKVLGIESTTPDWVNEKVEEITEKYDKIGVSKKNIQDLKDELIKAGFGNIVNEVIINQISKNND